MAPLLVLSLVDRLPEGSKTYAMVQSKKHWRAFMDITREYYALAGIFNAVNTNTAATGNFKKRPKFDPWPTPHDLVKRDKERPKTVADLYKRMTARSGA